MLVEFLREHWRMFASCPADMLGIPRELAEHELKIFPNVKPIKQSMCHYNPEKAQAMGKDVRGMTPGRVRRLERHKESD
jgi:hypothetical protein